MSLLLIFIHREFLITHTFRAKPRQDMTATYRTLGLLRLTKNSVVAVLPTPAPPFYLIIGHRKRN
jgi:hypothetical protein